VATLTGVFLDGAARDAAALVEAVEDGRGEVADRDELEVVGGVRVRVAVGRADTATDDASAQLAICHGELPPK
jgi:hypothetical protein